MQIDDNSDSKHTSLASLSPAATHAARKRPFRWIPLALFLAIFVTAVFLRFWNLGSWPPGLYRDEAFNGLDALDVLNGNLQIFYPANNGREPAYILLTAIAVTFFGQTAFAVRLTAAVVGALTTIPVFLLGKSWFGGRAGLLAAAIWAITLWPVHLSRIGLRVILLAPLLALTFWVGTRAYRRQTWWLWALSGLLYGAAFYTYLAARFTPFLLLALGLYLILTGRSRRLWPGVLWFSAGTAVALLPLIGLIIQQPELLLGRTGQVSILHPDVNNGDILVTLLRHTGQALGMFLWQGDTILRHNPVGRPVFDLFMAVPFLIGLVWCLRRWRRPPAAALLLWSLILLGPTILAADSPHFLRAAGVLPAVVFLPALGLNWLWNWPRLPQKTGPILVSVLLAGSLWLTLRDYTTYARQPETGYLFEQATSDLAAQINQEPPETAVYVDQHFWSGWPALSFLVQNPERVQRYQPQTFPDPLQFPAVVYAWPYGNLDFLPHAFTPPVAIQISTGSLTRGDLEPEAYPLFLRYAAAPETISTQPPLANFDNQLRLRTAAVVQADKNQLVVMLEWEADTAVSPNLSAFVHVFDPAGLTAQADAPPAQGRWLAKWQQPGFVVQEERAIQLPDTFDARLHSLQIGVYDAQTGKRLPLIDTDGQVTEETAVTLQP